MAQVIGNVKSFETGTFFAKGSDGQVRQLKAGDLIYDGEKVYGAATNGANAKIVIDVLLAGAGDLVISGNGALTFDTSLLAGIFTHHDAVVYVNSMQEALAVAEAKSESAMAKADVDADVTDAGETAAGESLTDTQREGDVFAARTGAVGDVTTSLNQTGPTTLEVTLNEPPLVLLEENSIPTVDWVLTEGGVAVVNEGGLIPEGNLGGSTETSGTINITTGGDTINTVGGVVINGVDVTNGGTVAGTYGDLVITLSAGTYSWTYTLNDNAPHTGTNLTGSDDQLVGETFSVVVTDDDGDSTAPANLTILINDDGSIAAIAATEGSVTIDETSGLDDDDIVDTAVAALFSGVADTSDDMLEYAQSYGAVVTSAGSAYGADQENGSTVFSLEVNGDGRTNLTTTDGDEITIGMEDGLLVGRDEDDNAVFAVSIDANSGVLSVVQYESITNPYSPDNHDETVSLSYMDDQENIVSYVNAVVTVTDGDGDVTTESIGIGGQISFSDDGPSANISLVSQASITMDETIGTKAGDANAASDDNVAGNLFNVAWGTPIGLMSNVDLVNTTTGTGSDNEGATTAVTLSIVAGNGTDSGLMTTDGTQINLYMESDGTVTGRTVSATGEVIFAISINNNGEVTVAQYDSLKNPTGGSSYDEAVNLLGKLDAVVTVTDGDLDVASDNISIGAAISFEDDGPTADAALGTGSVSHDETAGVDSDAGDTIAPAVAALFSGVTNVSTDMTAAYALGTGSVIDSSLSSYGQDEEGASVSTVYSLDVLTTGADSGLDTTDGTSIYLYKEGDLVVGRIGNISGDAAFAISIDANGVLSIAQYASIWHPTGGTGSYDESISITNGSLLATVTVTDGDGDINSDSVAINGTVSFQDDAPIIGTPQNLIMTNQIGNTVSGVDLDIMAGADEPISLVLTPQVLNVGGVDYAVDTSGRLLTSTVGGVTYNLVYQTASNGSVTAYQYINATTLGSAIFTLTPDLDTGTYTASYGGGIDGILDGVSTTYTLSYDSTTNNTGGNLPVIAYQFPDATPSVPSDNLYAVASANGTNTVNYSVGNGMGVGSGSLIDGSDILYIHFTDAAVKSGTTLVPGALGIAIENPLTLEEATFTITRFTGGPHPDTSVWTAYNNGVLVGTGSMAATGTGSNSTANVLISSKVVISTITVTAVNPLNGIWSVVNGVVSFVAAVGFTGDAFATVEYNFEGDIIGTTPKYSTTVSLAGGESLNLSLFSEVQFSVSAGDYAISSMTATVSSETVSVDNIINVEVAVTDSDGDVVTDNFNVTFDADGNLTGGSGSEVLVGGTGNDMIIGGGGDDTLIGNAGNDTLNGGIGNDTLDGGIGNDTASYANASSGVTVNLVAGTATGGDGSDTLTSIENVTGSAYGDTITGNDSANVLSGGLGNDTLIGGLGNDTLMGGDGNDILISDVATIGGVLTGDTGLDAIDGGAGIDTLILTTGSNIDFGVLNSGNNPITNIEVIDLSVSGANQLQNISLEDVLSITGKNLGESATLTIMGDAVDAVTLEGTWSAPVAGTGVDSGFDIYSHTDDPTVTLRVETVIGDVI